MCGIYKKNIYAAVPFDDQIYDKIHAIRRAHTNMFSNCMRENGRRKTGAYFAVAAILTRPFAGF